MSATIIQCSGIEPVFCEVKKDWFYCSCDQCQKKLKKKKRISREKISLPNVVEYNDNVVLCNNITN